MSQNTNDSIKHNNMWLILIATCLFTFMSTLDGSIVNIAMPTMSKDLAISMNEAEWIVSVYMITICCLLIFWGRISDTIGKIKIFKIEKHTLDSKINYFFRKRLLSAIQ